MNHTQPTGAHNADVRSSGHGHGLRSGVMHHDRFLAAAQRVLDGDDSIRAANELEGVVLNDYLGDERFDDLGEVLALYAPGLGTPYSDAQQVCETIRRTIADLD